MIAILSLLMILIFLVFYRGSSFLDNDWLNCLGQSSFSQPMCPALQKQSVISKLRHQTATKFRAQTLPRIYCTTCILLFWDFVSSSCFHFGFFSVICPVQEINILYLAMRWVYFYPLEVIGLWDPGQIARIMYYILKSCFTFHYWHYSLEAEL